MAFTVRNDVHVEELGDAYLVLVPDDERVYQLDGDQAEAFALARDGAKSVPEHLNTAMAGLVELGLVETKDWSRRKVLQMGGAAAAAAVVMLNMPSVAAAGSATTIKYLILGGGGGGGAGGAGASAYLEGATAAATNLTGTYTVSVGAGGLPSMYHLSFAGINQDLPNTGTNGGNSSITGPAAFGTKSVQGGGGGGSAVSDTSNLFGTKLNPGSAGGCGGGGGVNTNPLGTPSPAQAAAGATTTPPGQGFGGGLGGNGSAGTTYNGTGGGGGGATAAGKNFVLFTGQPTAPVSAPSTTISAGGAGIVSPLATAWSNNQPAEVIPPPNTVGQTTPYVPKRPTPTLYVGEQSGSNWYVAGGGGGSGLWMAGKGGLGGGGDGSATGNPTANPPVPPLYAPWVDGTQNTAGGAAGGGSGSNGVVIVAVTPYDKVTVPAATGVTKAQIGQTMYVLFTNTAVPPVPPPVVPPSPVTTPPNQSYTFTITT